jgi:hypothetical protein
VVRVKGFDDLRGLFGSALTLRNRESSSLPLNPEQHTYRDTTSLVLSRAHFGGTDTVVRLYLEEEWGNHGDSLLTT